MPCRDKSRGGDAGEEESRELHVGRRWCRDLEIPSLVRNCKCVIEAQRKGLMYLKQDVVRLY